MKGNPHPRPAKGRYIGFIADMVDSRSLAPAQRTETQQRFASFVDDLNKQYRAALAARFAITLGDEFQGLITDPSIIPDLVWQIEEGFTSRMLRVGFGIGTLSTPLRDFAINIDGPALHHARRSIELAKKDDLLGGVFYGFGDSEDLILNGFARELWSHRQDLSPQQRKVVGLLRQGLNQTEAATRLHLTKQAVSIYAKAARWHAYREGELGWRAAFAKLVQLP